MRSWVRRLMTVLVVLIAVGALRGFSPFRRLMRGGEGPIPGPPGDPVGKHLREVQVERASCQSPLFAVDPAFGIGASQNSLIIDFTPSATVGQANEALNAAGAEIVAVMPRLGLITVEIPGSWTFSGLEDAEAILISHRAIETAARNFVMGDSGLHLPMGIRSRPPRALCDWAALQVMKAYGITTSLNCRSTLYEINGKEVFVSVIRPDLESLLFAIVDDEGVYPLHLKAPGAAAPGNVLGLTDEELSTQRSPKLTGLTHWSQRTLLGQHAAALALHESGRQGSVPVNPVTTLRARYAAQLDHMNKVRLRCIDEYLARQPGTPGSAVNLRWKIHPGGDVSGIALKRDGESASDPEFLELEECITAELRRLTFPSHDSEDIFELAETYSVVRSSR